MVAASGCIWTSFAVLPLRRADSLSIVDMSYLDRLPTYSYELPCGHHFRSLTRSMPDDDDNRHWFYCKLCSEIWGIAPCDLAELPPLHPSGMRMSDNQLVVRINAAIGKDRVRDYYLNNWDAVSIRDVSAATGVQRSAVEAVATELGVYNDNPQPDRHVYSADYAGRAT
jgi:hypothetical protein